MLLIVQALRGEPLTICGNGQQTRSFWHAEDEVRGIVRPLMAPGSDEIHSQVNIGNPHELTILEISERILQLSNSRRRLLYEALPEDDPKVSRPGITRARTLLNWEPEIPLEEGLLRTIECFQTRLASQSSVNER